MPAVIDSSHAGSGRTRYAAGRDGVGDLAQGVRDTLAENGEIDPHVLIDDNGQAYLCSGNPISGRCGSTPT